MEEHPSSIFKKTENSLLCFLLFTSQLFLCEQPHHLVSLKLHDGLLSRLSVSKSQVCLVR